MSDNTSAEGDTARDVGVPSDNTTLREVLDEFLRSGFAGDVRVSGDGRLCCSVCGYCAEPREVALTELRRLEGASDPADMVAVLAVTCPACRSDGVAVVRYGPEAEAGDAIVLRELSDAPS